MRLLLAEDHAILADAMVSKIGQAGFAVGHLPNAEVGERVHLAGATAKAHLFDNANGQRLC